MVRGGSGVGKVRGGVSVPGFRTKARAKGHRACGGQHHSTYKDLKEGECSELLVQHMFVEHLFVSWALC